MTDGAQPGLGRDRIKHVLVLIMENRSFDHLVGYLDHPDPAYPSLNRIAASCPVDPDQPAGRRVSTTSDASFVLGNDPDHSHEAVMFQIFGRSHEPTMAGFIESYRQQIEHGTARTMSWWQRAGAAVLAFLKRLWSRLTGGKEPVLAKPDQIMRCFADAEIPVLGFLAKQYAVLVNWFAAVPGETWPNRQYAHAATSHGTSNIKVDFYTDKTIFERLADAGRSWAIYVDGVAQVWAYPKLWLSGFSQFHGMDRLMADIENGTLPDYAFIEPNHGFGPGEGNSQHPGNNTIKGDSFVAGEALMARIYNKLVANPAVFAETLFLITYDEHGGFFDHEPPHRVPAPDDLRDPGGFDFTLSGIRVPAVAISPLIPAGTVDPTFYDHSAIPAAVRKQFAPATAPLTRRDAAAADPLDNLPLLPTARTDVAPVPHAAPLAAARPVGDRRMNDFQSSLVDLAGGVHNARQRMATRALVTETPEFVPEPSTREAAREGVLRAGSEAEQVVRSVVDDFVREP